MSIHSDDSSDGQEHFHRGHDPELGLLSRIREWTDVFPFLRLTRTLRVAGSPPLVLLTALVFSIWCFGEVWILGGDVAAKGMQMESNSEFGSAERNAVMTVSHLRGLIPTSIYDHKATLPWWRVFLGVVWSLLIWAPTAMLLARQGALLTAGRTMVGLKPGISQSIRRSPAAWLAALVPLACVFAIGALVWGVGLLARLCDMIVGLDVLWAVVAAAIAIPCGVLAFGANVAVPLGWAALANERDPDALDSLSRGYEYLLRRPLQLVLYAALAGGILWVIGALAAGVAWAASSVATIALTLSGCSTSVQLKAQQILQFFPTVVILALLWSLVGGIYLLLRYDAGGQEVEDLWLPEPPPSQPLPSIPSHEP